MATDHGETSDTAGGQPGGLPASESHWTRKSVTVARTQVRRTLRQQTASGWKVLILAVALLFFGLLTLAGTWGARVVGEMIATGEVSVGGYVEIVRGVAGTTWLGLTVMIVLRAAGQRGARESTGGLLWVAPTKPIAAGLALSEFAFLLIWIGLPALLVGAGFAAGLGSPLAFALVVLAVTIVSLLAVAVGFPVGVGIRHVLTRFPIVKRYRTPLMVLLGVAYVAAFYSGAANVVFVVLLEPLALTPPGWIADLVFLAVPGADASPLYAGIALVQVAIVWPAAVALTWVANRHWFADPVLAEGDERDADGSVGDAGATGTGGADAAVVTDRPRLEQWLGRVTDRPTAALVAVAYRRAIRAPAKLLYAAMPFLFMALYVPDLVGGGVSVFLPVLLLLVVAWAAGVAFVLNPLGDQGNVLPATILSGVSGSQFVRAHVLATLVVVLPVGLVLPTAAAVASPLDAEATLLVLGVSPAIVVAGSLAGVGIGMAAPRFSSVKVSGSTEAVVPSKLAFFGYTLYLIATALAGLLVYSEGSREAVAALVSFLLPVSVSAGTLHLIAGAALAVFLLTPIVGYRYAVSRFQRVTLESFGG